MTAIKNQAQEMPADFDNEIHKWALECECLMITRYGLWSLSYGFLETKKNSQKAIPSNFNNSSSSKYTNSVKYPRVILQFNMVPPHSRKPQFKQEPLFYELSGHLRNTYKIIPEL